MPEPDEQLPVSVIACFYNEERYLPGFFSNVEASFLGRAQLVLVDDGSTDETPSLLSAWADGKPDVVVVRAPQNQGLAESRNLGLRSAERPYAWFIDADDSWPPHALTTLAAAALAHDADMVIGCADYRRPAAQQGRRIDGVPRSTVLDRKGALDLMLRGEIQGFLWSKLIRVSALAGDVFPANSPQEDFVGTVTALSRSATVVTVSETVYTYLNREASLSRTRNPALDRYAIARDSLVRVARDESFDPILIEYFQLWFHAIAVAFTPVRFRASPATVRLGTRLARAEIATFDLASIARIDRKAVLHARMIAHSGPFYAPALRLALSVHRLARSVRGR